MKHQSWKGQHPLRFTDTESVKSMGNRYKPAQRKASSPSEAGQMNTLNGTGVKAKKNLREILEQNNLYDEVLA